MTRNGASAVAFAGEEGAIVVDVGIPSSPVYRGPVAPPGFSWDGWWSGDTLLVAASLGLERYLAHPTPTAVASLSAQLDPASATPRAVITWPLLAPAELVGFNLYRDLGTSDAANPSGRRVNRDLLPPGTTSAVDDSVTAGQIQRYRLEGYFADGSSVKVAEGTLRISSAPLVGRVVPNPFRPRSGALASLGYRLPASAAGATLTLRVFDSMGRLVREITAAAGSAGGFGAIGWDGRGRNGAAVPSGVYHLRLTGAGLDDSRSVVLLR